MASEDVNEAPSWLTDNPSTPAPAPAAAAPAPAATVAAPPAPAANTAPAGPTDPQDLAGKSFNIF